MVARRPSLYYLGDPDGITNIYRLDFDRSRAPG